jgi:hypothetical protein
MALKIGSKALRFGQLFIPGIKLGLSGLLVIVNPFSPVFFEADMDVKIDDFKVLEHFFLSLYKNQGQVYTFYFLNQIARIDEMGMVLFF